MLDISKCSNVNYLFYLCNMCGTVKENMLERVSIHFFEAEEKLDGLVGIADLLNSIDLFK